MLNNLYLVWLSDDEDLINSSRNLKITDKNNNYYKNIQDFQRNEETRFQLEVSKNCRRKDFKNNYYWKETKPYYNRDNKFAYAKKRFK